jgi:LysR family transcriptional regulator, cyn operon transcriptional activator
MVMLPKSFSTRKILDQCLHPANAAPLGIAEINSLMPMIELIRISDLAGLVALGAITDDTKLSVIPIENPSP